MVRRCLVVVLDDDVYEELKDVSAVEGRTLTSIIKEAVEEEVKRSRWRRVLPFS